MDWRKSSVLILLILLAGTTAAEVQYEVSANKSSVLFNTTVQLECEDANCPVSSWSLTLDKPEDANLTNVSVANGELSDYKVRGDKILVQTRTEDPTRTEFIQMSYVINKKAEEIQDGLYSRSISLPGFGGETNSGSIDTENLILADTTHGFETQTVNDTFRFRGEGPTRASLSFGEGYETEYFEFFGAQPDETASAYEMVVGTLGFTHNSERMPAAVIPDEEYDETVNTWSSGRYIDGNIVLRKNLESDFLPVLAHETVHAFNDQHLKWDRTSTAWFDEGVSKYIEFLMKKSIEGPDRTRELFGDSVNYEDMKDGSRYRYTLPSKADKEKLWSYYQNNRSFMKSWSSSSDQRAFGYAYSELIVRNYVSQNNSLKELYNQLEDGPRVESEMDKWNYYSQYLDLTPCKYESRERFEACLERVNNYDYPVYSAEPGNSTQSLVIEEMEVPNNSELNTGRNNSIQSSEELENVLIRAINGLNSLLRDLVTSF